VDGLRESSEIFFLKRRVTGLALHQYFMWRRSAASASGDRIDVADIRRKLRVSTMGTESGDDDEYSNQFMNAAEDPFLACSTPFSSRLNTIDDYKSEDSDVDPLSFIRWRDTRTCVESAG
jgi:hypothetical protein